MPGAFGPRGQVLHRSLRLLLHVAFDLAALPVAARRAGRPALRGFGGVAGQQAADADAHVIEPARRVEARADGEAQVGGDHAGGVALCDREQRRDAGRALAGAHAADALRHQHAVVGIQRHQVRHRAQRHQVQPAVVTGARARGQARAAASASAARPAHRTPRPRRPARDCRSCCRRGSDSPSRWQRAAAAPGR